MEEVGKKFLYDSDQLISNVRTDTLAVCSVLCQEMVGCLAVSFSERNRCLLLSGYSGKENKKEWTTAECAQSLASPSCLVFEDEILTYNKDDHLIAKQKTNTADLCRNICLEVWIDMEERGLIILSLRTRAVSPSTGSTPTASSSRTL